MDSYAVIGNPVQHSLSPVIHSHFARQTSQNLVYTAQQVSEQDFEQTIKEFFETGGKGLNITLPYKEMAYKLVDHNTQRAQLAGAVNTLYLNKAGKLSGDNTDGIGLIKDIVDNHHGVLKGKKILILGAGGAVRGILQPLLAQQPQVLIIANRTLTKAMALADSIQHKGKIRACGLTDLTDDSFDWIINGTSASLSNNLPFLFDQWVTEQTCCYDLMYAMNTTAFNQWALEHGAAKTMDGLGMLVEQAAEAFYIWRGIRPQTSTLISWLRKGNNIAT